MKGMSEPYENHEEAVPGQAGDDSDESSWDYGEDEQLTVEALILSAKKRTRFLLLSSEIEDLIHYCDDLTCHYI